MRAGFSLAEIDAQCRKAVRGAGCPWGLAEEAGKAARWLSERGLPGAEAMAGLLSTPRACPCGGGTGPACALRVGAALSDRAHQIAAGETAEEEVTQPLIVLAMLGRSAEAIGASFAVEWESVRAVCAPQGLALDAQGALLTARATIRATPSLARFDSGGPLNARCDAASRGVAPESWAILENHAFRTYVPESDSSRAAGAGAGETDND